MRLISSKLNASKAEMSTKASISESNDDEIHRKISNIKQETMNGTKSLDLLKDKVLRMQEALDGVDKRLRQQVNDFESQKGKNNKTKFKSIISDYQIIRSAKLF